MAAVVHHVAPGLAERVRRSPSIFFRNRVVFLAVFIPAILVPYYALWATVGDGFVRLGGPFSLQLDRVSVYLAFFSVGLLFGIKGLPETWAGKEHPAAPRWWIPFLLGVILYGAYAALFMVAVSTTGHGGLLFTLPVLFVAVCSLSTFGIFGAFAVMKKRTTGLGASLAENSFGIYVLHFPMVAGLQFALLDVAVPGVLKGILVFVASLAAAWGLSIMVRSIGAIVMGRFPRPSRPAKA